MVFKSNPVDLFGWDDKDKDPLFARDASFSSEFGKQWTLHIMAQEAALKEVATSKLRRLLAYNESFNSTGVQIGDTVLFYGSAKRNSAPHWRGPAKIPDWLTAKFLSQTSAKRSGTLVRAASGGEVCGR